ncbi:MAG: hypothetical protein ACLFQK_11765, partial [Fibrobacterota bacterium]
MRHIPFEFITAAAIFTCFHIFAAPAPELPGREITPDIYMGTIINRDSVKAAVPEDSPFSNTWLEKAMETWNAPSITSQVASDARSVAIGAGAVFMPRMTGANLEPGIEIKDAEGKTVKRGTAGRKYSLMPGKYTLFFGSGDSRQKLKKKFTVTENRTHVLQPDWSGLSIEVIDENGVPFRGEYEIVRLDGMEPFGRGYGRDPALAEEVGTWILEPGIYKIFSPGQSFNTRRNFVTVRLIPGELVTFLISQDSESLLITGGGDIVYEETERISSNWKYGLDIGGTLLWNAKDNIAADTVESSSTLS